jgi:hypothetical protein
VATVGRALLSAVCVLYLAVVSVWLVIMPPFEGPDELHHYDYARYVAVTGHLPDRVPATATEGGWYTGLWTQEGLYYWVYGNVLRWIGVGDAAITMVESPSSMFRGGPDAPLLQHVSPPPGPLASGLRVGRLASAAFGLGTIICVFITLAHVTGSPTLAALATAALILVPEFGVRHAFVTNDTLVTLFGSVASALAMRWTLRRRWWFATAIGAATGGAIATKLTAGTLTLLPIARFVQRREPGHGAAAHNPRHLTAWAIGLTAAGAWPFVRNWIVFGDPLATRLKLQVIRLLDSPVVFDASNVESYLTFGRLFVRTFWASIGWAGFGPSAGWVWTLYTMMTVLLGACAVIAGVAALRETMRSAGETASRSLSGRGAAIPCSVIVVSHAIVMLVALPFSGTSRYLLPITVPLLVLAALGAQRLAAIWRSWVPAVPVVWVGSGGVLALALAWIETVRATAHAFQVIAVATVVSIPASVSSQGPGSPVGLRAVVSGTTVTLTWTAPTSGGPPSSYVVEAGSRSGRSDLAAIDTNSIETRFVATSVPAGDYVARVRAVNAVGAGLPSNEVRVTVPVD